MIRLLTDVGIGLCLLAMVLALSLWVWHRRWSNMFGRGNATEMLGESFPLLHPVFNVVWSDKPSAVDPERYVLEHRSPDRSTEISHLDGVPWHQATIPPRLHRCWAQTKGWTGYITETHRCACGATRTSSHQRWWDRNSRSESVAVS